MTAVARRPPATLGYPCGPPCPRHLPMTLDKNQRPLEPGIHTDLHGRMTYAGYLHLER